MADVISGPWFEDFTVGDEFADAPAVTITAGYAAIHQALFGDHTRLPLNVCLCKEVTGRDQLLVNSSLVTNLVI